MVDEPSAGKYFGGDVAAPVFSARRAADAAHARRAARLDVKPQIVVRDVPAEEESF